MLLYDTDGGLSPGEEQHLHYLTQAPIAPEGSKDLESVLGGIIAQQLAKIPRRTKQKDISTFEFRAIPINREYQPQELPRLSGSYANPHHQRAETERRI